MDLSEVKIKDLLNQKEQLLRERQDLSDCIENIDKELEHIKAEEIKNIFETIEPYLDRLERLGAVISYRKYCGEFDKCTGSNFRAVGRYIIERI